MALKTKERTEPHLNLIPDARINNTTMVDVIGMTKQNTIHQEFLISRNGESSTAHMIFANERNQYAMVTPTRTFVALALVPVFANLARARE